MNRWILAAMVAAVLASSVAGLAITNAGRHAGPAIDNDGVVSEVVATAKGPQLVIPTAHAHAALDIAAPDGRVNAQ
jgi:hypothetical protein